MAPSNKVAYVLTGDGAGLGSVIDDNTKRIQKLEEQLAKATEKLRDKGKVGKEAYGALSKGVVEYASGVLGGITLTRAFEQALKVLEERAKALREETQRSAKDVAALTGQNGASVLRSPSITPSDLNRLNVMTRRVAETSGLGDEAVSKVGDALTALLPRQGITDDQRRAIVANAAPIVRMKSDESLTDIAKGTASLVENLGVQPMAAQNMLMSMGGKIGSPSARAQLVESLKAFAGPSGMRLDQAMALAGAVSTSINDTQGDATATVIQGMYRKLIADPSSIEKRLGAPLQGGFLDRLRQLQGANAAAVMSGEDAESMGLGRGPTAALAAQALLSPRGAALVDQNLAALHSGMNLPGSIAAQRYAIFAGGAPGAKTASALKDLQARQVSERSGDYFAADLANELKAQEEEARANMRTAGYIEVFKTRYENLRRKGLAPERAMQGAHITAAASEFPIFGNVMKWATQFESSLTASGTVAGRVAESEGSGTLKDIHAELKHQNRRAPQRPLPSAAGTSN